LKKGEVLNLQDLRLLFAPTGSFQEIAISNGWGEAFFALAVRFDEAVKD
jgi:hypothetical protein